VRVAELAFPNRSWCYLSTSFLFHLMGLLASTSIHGTVLVFHVLHYGYFCVFFCPRQYHTYEYCVKSSVFLGLIGDSAERYFLYT